MKIVLITSGSRGDVQPVLALAVALQAAGHQIRLAAPPENATWIRRLGCRFHPIGGNFEALLNRLANAHSARAALAFLRYVRNDLDRQFDRLPDIMPGADGVIAASLSIAAPSLARYYSIPYTFLAFCPQLLPSCHHPPPSVKYHGLPKWLNRGFWALDRQLDRLLLRPLINRRRKRLNLEPIGSTIPHLLGRHVILAADAALAPVPPDVTQAYTQLGSFQLPVSGEIEKGLAHFLNSGLPPIFVGFGSMPKQDLKHILPKIYHAAEACKQRLVVAVGSHSYSSPHPDVWMAAGDLPHPLIFKKVAAVLHHGGAGTTATVARAGVPQILVPHVLDQFFWADRVFRLGIGPRMTERSRLSSKNLIASLSAVAAYDGFHQRARSIAQHINRFDSLNSAVRLIESGKVWT